MVAPQFQANDVIEFVCINGLPFSGKDTQAELIEELDKSAVRLSPGEILHRLVARDKNFLKYFNFDLRKLEKDLLVGNLVNGDELANGLSQIVRDELEKGMRKIIFAGWPREEESFGVFQKLVDTLRDENEVKTHFIYLKTPDSEARKRFESEMKKRKKRGRVPRTDDTPEGFEHRFRTFHELTLPFLKRHKSEMNLKVVESQETKHGTQVELYRALGWTRHPLTEGRLPQQARR